MGNVFKRYWTETELARLLAVIRKRSALQARRDAAWIALLVATGFRIGEFSRLTVADAEAALAEGWLFVPRERRKGKHLDHQVPVTRRVEQALRELLTLRTLMGGAREPGAPLVLSRRHRAMSVRSYQARLALWCREAGVEGTPHFGRHTRAMRIMRGSTAKDPRGLVQAALGHASLASTGIYTRVTKEDLQRELELLDGAPRVKRSRLRARYEARAVA